MKPEIAESFEVKFKAGGEAFLHVQDGKIWLDTQDVWGPGKTDAPPQLDENGQPIPKERELSGGDLIYQTALSLAHSRGLQFAPDPRSISDKAARRRVSHLLSSALRYGTTRHIAPQFGNSQDRIAPGWREEKTQADYQHNLDLLIREEMKWVAEEMANMPAHRAARYKRENDAYKRKVNEAKRTGQAPPPAPTRPDSVPDLVTLDDLHYDPESDTVLQKQKGPDGSVHWKRLSQGDFETLVARMEPRDSGISAATLSRALVAKSALEGHETGRSGIEHLPIEEPHQGGGVSQDPSSEIYRVLRTDAAPRSLFYSQGRAQTDGSAAAPGNNLDGHPAPRVLSTGVSRADTDAALAGLRGSVDLDGVLIVDSRDDLDGRDGRPAQDHYHARDWEGIRTAEGFVDPHNGQIVLLRGNIQVREGETPALAAARVILHERVGHLGINAVLATDPRLKDRWTQLSSSIPRAELDSLRQRYPHLPADSPGLALEWLAHQTGDRLSTANLSPGSLPAQMWQTLRDWVARTFHSLSGGRMLSDAALDAHVRSLIHAAQKHSRPGSTGLKSNQVGLPFSQPTSNESHHHPISQLDRVQGIPYDTQHGDSPAGRDAEAALAELRERARQRADARGSSRTDEAEWLDSEAKSLVSWAQERGWLVNGESFAGLTAHLDQLEGESSGKCSIRQTPDASSNQRCHPSLASRATSPPT